MAELVHVHNGHPPLDLSILEHEQWQYGLQPSHRRSICWLEQKPMILFEHHHSQLTTCHDNMHTLHDGGGDNFKIMHGNVCNYGGGR